MITKTLLQCACCCCIFLCNYFLYFKLSYLLFKNPLWHPSITCLYCKSDSSHVGKIYTSYISQTLRKLPPHVYIQKFKLYGGKSRNPMHIIWSQKARSFTTDIRFLVYLDRVKSSCTISINISRREHQYFFWFTFWGEWNVC